jgi:hypothetical protein
MIRRVEIMMSESDADLLRQAASESGCTMSALLRHLLRQHLGLPDDLGKAMLPDGQRKRRRPQAPQAPDAL